MSAKLKAIAIVAAILLAMAVGLAVAGIRTVEEGYVGIKKVGGAAQEGYLTPGWHIINPFTDTIETIEVRFQTYKSPVYQTASKDLQPITSQFSVSYGVAPASAVKLYKELGPEYAERIIIPAAQEAVKASTSQYGVAEMIQKRSEIKAAVYSYLSATLEKNNMYLREVFVDDLSPIQAYMDRIQQAENVKRDQEIERQNLERERIAAQTKEAIAVGEQLKRVAEAEGLKNATVLAAEGEAEAIFIKGKAQADAIKAIEEACDCQYIDIIEIEKYSAAWNGQLPYITGSDGSQILDLRTLAEIAAITNSTRGK